MRGKASTHPQRLTTIRITPAYAGKSKVEKMNYTFYRDHPRVCGEKRKGKVEKMTLKGSPPRMRGKEEFKNDKS